MKGYCKNIEIFIVDYFDGAMDERAKAGFEQHIGDCESCRHKYEEFKIAMKYSEGIEVAENSDGKDRDIIFNMLRQKNNRYMYSLRYAIGAVAILVILFTGLLFNNYYDRHRFEAVRNLEMSVEYIYDTEDLILEADNELYEDVVSKLYGDDYRDFEEIISETSIFNL